MTESTDHPLSGLWQPTQLQALYYGPSSVKRHLLSHLPSDSSKAFIITGSSLATKTSLIRQVESLLGPKHHAGTFTNITQHAPIAQLDEATDSVLNDPSIDTLISIGGGSPIDSAKVISYRSHEKNGGFLYHITIPTTLSAAECTLGAGYTDEKGTKVTVAHPRLIPQVILYDSTFAKETPPKLWLSTGIRSLDHTVELLYYPTASEAPTKQSCLTALSQLFEYLPKCKKEPDNEDYITRLQLASFMSLFGLGLNLKGSLGLSHTLGYALGSPYGIPHGMTSCLTLPSVVRLKADNLEDAEQIVRILPFIGHQRSGDDKQDAIRVGDAIDELLKTLGLDATLKDYNVDEDQIPKITKMATNSDQGELYDKVASLIRSKL
ncbi:MAG: hypothetical protein L6R38_000915 [Xanthoria sp. 2 TBL-2021]|nr:MAG: hypothetical protein L6R38_000915 [Xanthoria sp. 2 TBL-2021]